MINFKEKAISMSYSNDNLFWCLVKYCSLKKKGMEDGLQTSHQNIPKLLEFDIFCHVK